MNKAELKVCWINVQSYRTTWLINSHSKASDGLKQNYFFRVRIPHSGICGQDTLYIYIYVFFRAWKFAYTALQDTQFCVYHTLG